MTGYTSTGFRHLASQGEVPAYHYLAGTSPTLFHIPHSGILIPADVRRGILLADEELQDEIITLTDHNLDILAQHVMSCLGRQAPHAFTNNLSRLVVDPERFPDEREEMLAVGMGAVYTQGSRRQKLRDDNQEEHQHLLEKYFTPYASNLSSAVSNLFEAHGKTTIIDLHSYPSVPSPYELHGKDHRPEVCLGIDPFHTPIELVEKAVGAFSQQGFEVAINTPFSGTYIPLKHYETNALVNSLMIEIRRDMYLDESNISLSSPQFLPRFQHLCSALLNFTRSI